MKRFWKWLKREPVVIVRWTDPAEQRRRIVTATPQRDAYHEGWRRFWDEVDHPCCHHRCRSCGRAW